MKKLLLLITFLLIPSASAQENWEITEFHSDLTVREDGHVLVEETISVDFGALQKHGIFRDIPVVYEDAEGARTYTELEIQNVQNNGNTTPYEVSSDGNYVTLKIGDPDVIISGEQRYEITYLATGVLRSFENFDELYWNVTGNNWPVLIAASSARVTLPEAAILQSSCYLGTYGSPATCTSEVERNTVNLEASEVLFPNEGMTVAVGFEPGLVPILTVEAPPTVGDIFASGTTWLLFFLTAGIGIFLIVRHWWRTGRDRWWRRKSLHDPDQTAEILPLGATENIVVEYEPPMKLRPAEIGVLMDEKAHTLDVSATVVDLAARGYLTITEIPKSWTFGKSDYALQRKDKADTELLDYEKKLLTALFGGRKKVELSDLKNSFYTDLKVVKQKLYEEVVRKKLFEKNPESVRTKYLLWGILLVFLGILGTSIGVGSLSPLLTGIGLGFGLTAIVFLIFSRLMPRKTAYGRELYRQARGYEVFINHAEKHQQRFLEKENIFQEVLPYAIVFGATKKLAEAMKVMGIQPAAPAWYVGTHPFNATAFSRDIGSFSTSLSHSIASTPSSSGSGGGGFSGGGFGGGGGGSW